MLSKVLPEGSQPPRRRMTVTNTPAVALYHQRIDFPADGDGAKATLIVTYHPSDSAESREISMPLMPNVSGLEILDTALHASPAKAYNMGSQYNSWFSSCFGYEVVLAYLGPHRRPVRGNLSPGVADEQRSSKSWLSGLMGIVPALGTENTREEKGLTFADVAPYLVVTEESLKDVTARLSDGRKMDMRKFRPNIVVSGATAAYDEDYWGGLEIAKRDAQCESPAVELILTHNCTRCVSLNIDFSTGKATDNVLKKLMKDRRVDKVIKYSPVFGRYAFLKAEGLPGCTIAVGDSVTICKRNKERTGLGTRISYCSSR